MVREYELMYIVRPELDEEGLQGAAESVQKLIETQGGEVLKTTMWGKRRLAYEVKHLRDGYYVILRLRLDGAKVVAVERALRIHDTVFRHLLVAKEEGVEDEDEELDGAAPAATETTAEAPRAAAADDNETEAELEPVGAGADEEEE